MKHIHHCLTIRALLHAWCPHYLRLTAVLLLLVPASAQAQQPDDRRAQAMIRSADSLAATNADTAQALWHEAVRVAKADSIKIDGLLCLADHFSKTGTYDSVMLYAGAAATLGRLAGRGYDEARAHTMLGNAWIHSRSFARAQQHYLKSLALLEATGNRIAVGNAQINIGNLFMEKEDTGTALRYYRQAEAIYRAEGNEERLGQAYNNYGILYANLGMLDTALFYFQASTTVRERTDPKGQLGYNYMNLGGIYLLRNNYGPARIYLEKALAIFQKQGNTEGVTGCLNNLGELALRQKDFATAISTFERALALARAGNDVENLENCIVNISNAYQTMGDYKKAYDWDEELLKLKDSVYSTSQSRDMAELQTKYETAQKERRIAELHAQTLEQQKKIRTRNALLGGGLALFLLSGFAGMQYYKRTRLQQQARLQAATIRQQDESAKAIIAAEEQERRRIAGELHDGLGQLFAAVRMNLSGLGPRLSFADGEAEQTYNNTLDLVDESCSEVRSISHQMMPNTLLKHGLAAAVRNFITKIDGRRLHVTLNIHGLEERLHPSVEAVLYRVVQETVNNVIKHAGATALDISLSREPDGITATIEDNGKGFDTTEGEAAEGIGLKNIRTRMGYLRGTVEFDSAPGRGTVVSLWVPGGDVGS